MDERVFATCSDDTSVAIWDARYLKSKVKTFQGHTNCVKNIEYSPRYILDEVRNDSMQSFQSIIFVK